MKKVILLSTVLGLGALGMACGESANTNVTVKPANTTAVNTVNAAVSNAQAAVNNVSNAINQMAIKPATNMATNAGAKPVNTMTNANVKK